MTNPHCKCLLMRTNPSSEVMSSRGGGGGGGGGGERETRGSETGGMQYSLCGIGRVRVMSAATGRK